MLWDFSVSQLLDYILGKSVNSLLAGPFKRETRSYASNLIFQLLTQVLNRVTSRSNMFDTVVSVSMPGLETVDHFPILTAVTGILITLIVKASEQR